MTTIHGRKEFSWVKNSLWYKDNYILALVPDEEHKHMFWIKWPDGTKSADFYNITRAKQNALTLTLKEMNMEEEEVV